MNTEQLFIRRVLRITFVWIQTINYRSKFIVYKLQRTEQKSCSTFLHNPWSQIQFFPSRAPFLPFSLLFDFVYLNKPTCLLGSVTVCLCLSVCLSVSVSLSLTHTHAHTHKHIQTNTHTPTHTLNQSTQIITARFDFASAVQSSLHEEDPSGCGGPQRARRRSRLPRRWTLQLSSYFTMIQNRKKHRIDSHLIIHFPTSEEVSEVSKRVSAAERMSKVSRAERENEWGIQANGQASGPVLQSWFLMILDHSEPPARFHYVHASWFLRTPSFSQSHFAYVKSLRISPI